MIFWSKCGKFVCKILAIGWNRKDLFWILTWGNCREWHAEGVWSVYWSFWTCCWPLWVWPWWAMGSTCWLSTKEPPLMLFCPHRWAVMEVRCSLVDHCSWVFPYRLVFWMTCPKLGMAADLISYIFCFVFLCCC